MADAIDAPVDEAADESPLTEDAVLGIAKGTALAADTVAAHGRIIQAGCDPITGLAMLSAEDAKAFLDAADWLHNVLCHGALPALMLFAKRLKREAEGP